MTRVKICGITRKEDANAAVAAGVDLIGLMFYSRSPRSLDLAEAVALAKALPEHVGRVGVFVDEDETVVRRIAEACALDYLQFHGEETPEYCRLFQPLKVIKAFRVRDADSLRVTQDYGDVGSWLLDSYVSGKQGGTGEQFNWDLAIEAKRGANDILLAGGLTPSNVRRAVKEVRPWGVDVSTGVELRPGIKDAQAMRRFIEEVRAADRDLAG